MDVERAYPPLQRRNQSACQCICEVLKLIRYLPFVLITTLYIWGLYVYLYYIIICFFKTLWLQLLLVLLFAPLYILSLWCYFRTVLARHRFIPYDYQIPNCIDLNAQDDHQINENLELVIQSRNLPIFTRSFGGYVRYCRYCMVIKPDRTHHCTPCGRCISKMDHHCHWVSNCVAFDNYKYFLLFLSYTIVLCLYVVGTSHTLFMQFWRDHVFPGKFQVFFLIVFCAIFALSISFLLSYHIYLVLKNTTTLEAYQPPRFKQSEYDAMRFDLGAKRNLISVFGDNRLLWFFPVQSSYGDGFLFQLPLNPAKANSRPTCTNGDMGDNHGASTANHLNV